MKARKAKRRVLRLMHSRLHMRSLELDELRRWDDIAPVGREFGSPDFDQLLAEDIHRWQAENPATR